MLKFSVIIPTLQRAAELHPLVELCAAHPKVGEVIVINNAPEPISWESPKVRILQQEENIFVNPAWNLGVRESRENYLAILNDDILFDPRVFDVIARWLRLPFVGIIGPHRWALERDEWRPRLFPMFERSYGFGCAMFMRSDRYEPVPPGMKIFFGDDWLLSRQRHRNFSFIGLPIRTNMSVTSHSFNDKESHDRHVYESFPEGVNEVRYAGERRMFRRILDARARWKGLV